MCVDEALASCYNNFMDRKAKFLKVYANLPLGMRQEVVIVHDNRPLSWDAVYVEVENDTPSSVALLEKLEKLDLI